METANDTAMHVTETKTLCSSPTCPPSKSEEITKDQEEELLCGNSEDGDEEDALSDDSMRLRLSDDEAELDEPSASQDATVKKPDQESTNLELGSDVPAVDTSEQKSEMRIQKLSNGICTVESNNMRVNQEDQRSNDAFVKESVPTSDDFNDSFGNSKQCNGSSAQTKTKPTEEASITKNQCNQWRISRKSYSESNKYATDPYNDKYYNKNTYYGGGKGSGRAYSNMYPRKSLSREGTPENKYSPRVYSPNTTTEESESSQITSASFQQIESASPTMQPLDVDNSTTNNVESESSESSKIPEPVNDREETNGLSKINTDNAEAASNVLNSLGSEQILEDDDLSHEKPLENSNVDSNLSNVNVASGSEEVNVGVSRTETFEAGDLSNNDEVMLNKENQISPEIESTPASPTNLDNDTEEADKGVEKMDEDVLEKIDEDVSEKIDEDALEKIDEDVSEKIDEDVLEKIDEDVLEKIDEDVLEKIDEDVLEKIDEDVSEKIDEDVSEKIDENVSEKIDENMSEKIDENSSDKFNENLSEQIDEQTNELASDENPEVENVVEEEYVIEEIEREDSVPVESIHRSSLERAGVELSAEIKMSDDLMEIENQKDEQDEPNQSELPKPNNQKDEQDEPNQSELPKPDNQKVEEDEPSRSELPKPDDQKDENDESIQSELPKPESSVEDTEKSQGEVTAVPADTEKQSNVEEPEQALKETPMVPTVDSETVEKDVVSVDKEISSQPQNLDIEAHIADLPDEKETSSEDEGDVNNVRMHTSLKRTPPESLDEMELFKRMRIQRTKADSNESIGKDIAPEFLSMKKNDAIIKTDNSDSTVVNPVTNSIAECQSETESETSLISNNVVENLENQLPKHVKPASIDGKENIEKIDDCEVIEVPMKRRPKRSRRSLQTVRETVNSQEDTQEKENVRQKRRTAKNAEEIIRKEFLGNSDSESNDSAGNFVAVNYNKTSNTLRAASPPTLKRNYEEDEKIEPSAIKKMKQDLGSNRDVKKTESLTADKVQTLAHVRRFFRRDNNGRLSKLKQEELEELLIQKVVETITMRDEIGKLREQAKISERNQEATRLKCQQLAKQIKDFEMVLNRYQSDRRTNPEKTVVPIKINRSVGLQVNFVTDHGIQNLRQLGQVQKPVAPMVNGTGSPQQTEQSPGGVQIPKRTIKVRSPRRPDPPVAVPSITNVQPPVHSQPIMSSITPPALIASKNVTDSRTPVTPTVHQTTVPHLIAPKQTIVVNGPITNQPIRQATAIQVSKANNSDLIDLTQEEDKTRSNVVPQNSILTAALSETAPTISNVQKIAPRYHTVIQTVPGGVAFTAQQGIRVVQPSSQPTPTALVNNMNAPRLTYVMQGGMGPTRQVVVTSSPAPIRPAPTIRTSYPLTGTITNGTVRVIPMTSTATLQVYKHPAALPESLNPPSNPSWKLPPPAPSLKISKVANGIVLSWNMALSDKYADIASYQLYAYQEISGVPPSSTSWKKVGDVRALPLPMACTLTQFSEGNNYYFAVRAVDKHSRLGVYSQPGNISL